ncbi:MAG TPA: hypothetical protein VH476_10140 [Solirubrobacterales bacterium]
MGDQGRARDSHHLGGERRRQGQNVADDDVGPQLLEQRHQRPCRLGGVIAFGRVGVGGREHPVFLGRGEAEAGVLDRGAALLPRLERDLGAARRQRPAEGDRGKDVAGVAEGGDQVAPRGRRTPRSAG